MSDSILLAQWMAGDFSNHHQAAAEPQHYAHIRIFFRPLPFEFFNAIGFYSEQVYDYDLWSPYRQGVHKLVDRGEDTYIENYSLNDAMLYAGAAREPEILQTITLDCLERRQHCSMIFQREGDLFRGRVEPGSKCLIDRNGVMTYLISDVEIGENTWVSLDKGMDINTHEKVWGSAFGMLRFEKVTSFADEIKST
ncbi:chromophore lyase CpcT/CpeT [Chamaesiphon sp.]|uniref:chromophore lyase CpcT/CpeT n=1 Tax=Chamaesiphon sp. TaxID=2814140 RepID=UPI0035941191